MVINYSFYFIDKQETVPYRHKPQGILNVNRLVRNQPSWKKVNLGGELKQKSLVIADWTAKYWSKERISALQKIITRLMEEGFPVYLWQDGEVSELTKDTLSCLNNNMVREAMTPEFIDSIAQAAVTQHSLRKDQIHVLDDYWLDFLLSGQEQPQHRRLYISHLTTDQAKLLSVFQRAIPTLAEAIHDVFSPQINPIVLDVRTFFPQVIVSTAYKNLVIEKQQIETLLSEGRITQDGATLSVSQLPDIECLVARGEDINTIRLQELLTRLPNLKKLNLAYCKLPAGFTEKLHLAQLQELSLTAMKITTEDLQRLLVRADTLKTLDLNFCEILGAKVTKKLNLAQLESLLVSGSQFTMDDLKQLLTGVEHLKTLDLSDCKNLSAKFTGQFKLASLEVLDVSNSNITADNLQHLLAGAEHLKTLKIRSCQNLSTNFTEKLNLAQLEVLDVSESTITKEDLQRLLIGATHLKELNLSYYSNLPANFTEKLHLLHLQRLSLNKSNITGEDLQCLLARAKGLKVLNLGYCQSLAVNFTRTLKLASLKTLFLGKSNITTNNLQHLLVQSEHLEVLNLESCQNLFADFTEKLNLALLKSLNVRKSNISTANLKTLLRATPSLKKLYLRDSTRLVIDDELKELLKGIETDLLPSSLNIASTKSSQTPRLREPHSIDSIRKINADTTYNPNKKFKVTRIFFPLDPQIPFPEVNRYRLRAFNTVTINPLPCALNNAFTRHNEGSAELVEQDITRLNRLDELVSQGKKLAQTVKDGSYFFGKQTFVLSGEWQAIASLSAEEVMTHCHISPEGAAVSFCYSQRDNLYYLRGPKNQQVTLDFLVKVNTPRQSPSLPDEIRELVDKLSRLGKGSLDLSERTNPTGDDYLECIIQQEKGACGHRAFAFKALMQKHYPTIPVRIITNDCHDFVEVQIEGQWLVCDLGGYPAKLTIDESQNPEESALNAPIETSVVLNDEPQVSPDAARYEKQLATWEKTKPAIESVLGYCHHAIQAGESKKRLVELTASKDVQALQLSMQHYCQQTSRPFFYINSPDDLVCSAPFVARDNDSNQGVLTKGPGGSLHRFLQTHQDESNPPVLIVNYDKFDADDMVRFNGLLDKVRHADGTPLAANALVVGLININKPDCYQGSDFYSRFDRIETSPVTSDLLTDHLQAIAPLPVRAWNKDDLPEKVATINLYNASDWEERLLGRWEVRGDNLFFVAGELEQALAKGLAIEIQNGLWDDENFKLFWQQAFLRGSIEYAGRKLLIPASLQLIASAGYAWDALRAHVDFDTTLSPQAEVLNPARLSDFFSRYQCNDGRLNPIPGLLDAHANEDFHLNLTRALSNDEWALLLMACQQKKVHLRVHCAPSVEVLPPLVEQFTVQESVLEEWAGVLNPDVTVIVSTDVDSTISQLTSTNQEEPYQIIDVSECEGDDLLVYTHCEFDKESCRMVFQQSTRALLQALEQNKPIILKGHFSENLIDALAPIVLARQKDAGGGQLVLVSEEENCFNYLPAKRHVVNNQEKRSCLERTFQADEVAKLEETWFTKEPLSRLKARLTYLRRNNAQTASENAWQGMQGLSGGIQLGEFNAARSAEIAHEFNQNRLHAVNDILADAPYVFLTGLTGVGKSTFVEKNFNTTETELYQGESTMRQWAQDSSTKRKILFIDEANLSQRQWSEFEGLFDSPPGLLIEGQYYPLTEQHKVVFAGNPISYGDERKLAPFFARHGNALVFEPLPQEFIYEAILKPVFANSSLEADVAAICHPLLNVYRFLCECSKDKVLISPRELQMMALLVLSYARQHHPSQDVCVLAAQHYAYQLASHLVPEKFRAMLDEQFKPSADLPQALNKPIAEGEFLVTASRQGISQQLDDLLVLRQLRREADSNKEQRYGGLGGIVLEGEPGIGKSELVIASLRAHGYEEVHDFHLTPNKQLPQNPFYRMPVSMQIEDKKELLRTAFEEGAVVIIEEINSSPMMERFLNDLLMGYTPEKTRPDKPGFLVIGTQNPVTMAGRRAPSTALERRLITAVLPTYRTEEMKAILISKGVAPHKVSLLIRAYEKNVKKAQQEHLLPAPTFRDLDKLAEQVIQADKIAQKEAEKTIQNMKVNFEGCESMSKVMQHREALLKEVDSITHLEPHNVNSKKAEINLAARHKQCLLLLSHMHFDEHLSCFEAKTKEMEEKVESNSNYEEAVLKAREFCISLENAKKIFLGRQDQPFGKLKQGFKEDCQRAIEAAKPALEKHYEWKGALFKFISDLLAILTGGYIGLFSAKTEYAKEIDVFKEDTEKKYF